MSQFVDVYDGPLDNECFHDVSTHEELRCHFREVSHFSLQSTSFEKSLLTLTKPSLLKETTIVDIDK